MKPYLLGDEGEGWEGANYETGVTGPHVQMHPASLNTYIQVTKDAELPSGKLNMAMEC